MADESRATSASSASRDTSSRAREQSFIRIPLDSRSLRLKDRLEAVRLGIPIDVLTRRAIYKMSDPR